MGKKAPSLFGVDGLADPARPHGLNHDWKRALIALAAILAARDQQGSEQSQIKGTRHERHKPIDKQA